MVALPYGSDSPAILRPQEDGTFIFHDFAYVHGIMRGELWKLSQRSELNGGGFYDTLDSIGFTTGLAQAVSSPAQGRLSKSTSSPSPSPATLATASLVQRNNFANPRRLLLILQRLYLLPAIPPLLFRALEGLLPDLLHF